MNRFLPEGMERIPEAYTTQELLAAMAEQRVLQAPAVLCDEKHDLYVDLGCCRGRIPRSETAEGIPEGTLRDIAVLSRVGRPVSFVVQELPPDGPALLSRRLAQRMAMDCLLTQHRPGDILPVCVLNCTEFGAFCDVGCGAVALLHTRNLCICRTDHAAQRLAPGEVIPAILKELDPERRRVSLSVKELLGTWAENAARFRPGQTVTGTVRSVRPYGAFVELTPNLSGLTEPGAHLQPGQAVSVYIKSIQPEQLKLKLAVIGSADPRSCAIRREDFVLREGHLSVWRYGSSTKPKILTAF